MPGLQTGTLSPHRCQLWRYLAKSVQQLTQFGQTMFTGSESGVHQYMMQTPGQPLEHLTQVLLTPITHLYYPQWEYLPSVKKPSKNENEKREMRWRVLQREPAVDTPKTKRSSQRRTTGRQLRVWKLISQFSWYVLAQEGQVLWLIVGNGLRHWFKYQGGNFVWHKKPGLPHL